MIRLDNMKEDNLAGSGPQNAALPFAPTVTAVVLPKYVAPQGGRIKTVEIVVAVAGAVGNSTDLLETLVMNKRGLTGAVSAVAITQTKTVFSAVTGALVPAPVGTVIQLFGLSGVSVVKGEILELQWTETGTLGTATRPTFNVTKVNFEANRNLSHQP
jgi:hypothetical protein